MAVGKVKWFNDEKGWGFIKQDAGPDVFVHYSQISGDGRRRLFEDEIVEFEIKEGPKGLQAINVVRQEMAAKPDSNVAISHRVNDRALRPARIGRYSLRALLTRRVPPSRERARDPLRGRAVQCVGDGGRSLRGIERRRAGSTRAPRSADSPRRRTRRR